LGSLLQIAKKQFELIPYQTRKNNLRIVLIAYFCAFLRLNNPRQSLMRQPCENRACAGHGETERWAGGKQEQAIGIEDASDRGTGLVRGVSFLPCVGSMNLPRPGWHFWPRLWRDLQDPINLVHGTEDGIALASILNFSLLITVSPFLTNVWIRSRIAWWFATICSGLAAAALWWLFFVNNPDSPPRAGIWCLLFAPLLNFFGLLLARG
jgi:hypothetical protein